MRLGVFAPEASGKSSYLTGLYAVLNDKNLLSSSEYALSYTIEDRVTAGRLDDECFALLMKRGKGRFPEKTNELTRYKITVRHKETRDQHVVEILDFPGESVRGDKPGVTTAGEVAGYHSQCDAFIVLLDGNHLAQQRRRQTSYLLAASQIQDQVDEAIGLMAKRELTRMGTPVAFCISKVDLLTTEQQLHDARRTVHDMFVRIFERNPPNPVLLAGVSLGKDIESDGEFDPFQLEVPLEFCLAMCATNATQYNAELGTSWSGYRETTAGKLQRRAAMNWLGRTIDRLDTGRSMKSYVDELESDTKRRDEYRQKTQAFGKLGAEALKALHDAKADDTCEVFLGVKPHRFSDVFRPTTFPLEAL